MNLWVGARVALANPALFSDCFPGSLYSDTFNADLVRCFVRRRHSPKLNKHFETTLFFAARYPPRSASANKVHCESTELWTLKRFSKLESDPNPTPTSIIS